MASEILQKNLESIMRHNTFALNELLQIDFSHIGSGVAEEVGINGARDVYFCHDEKKYLLHSSYDPIAETQKIIPDVEKTRDYLFIVFGIGLGFHLF